MRSDEHRSDREQNLYRGDLLRYALIVVARGSISVNQ
jgi:hypothetical protein